MVEKKRPYAIYEWAPSMTKQSFTEECDINMIVARASTGADISHVNARVAQYGDFSQVPSYQAALDLVNRANGMFMSMDASVRERFNNDPARMVAFLQDSNNRDEAVKLGLVEPPKVVPEPPLVAASGPETKVSKAKASARDEA